VVAEARRSALVWIVDDDQAITAMLGRVIELIGFEAHCFNDGPSFLAHYDGSRAGCLLTDMTMPGMTGLELLQQLSERAALPPTIVITGHGNIPLCVEAMRLGVFDFIQKPFSPAKLKELVRAAVDSDCRRRQDDQQAHRVHSRLAELSPEERATLQLLLEGSMNKHIAATLDVSRRTVQYRIASLLAKLGVESRNQLISLVAAANIATSLV
jgi:two-component system response regulator FixJ